MAHNKLFSRFALLGALMIPSLAATAQQISVFPQPLLSRDTVVKLRVTTLAPYAYGRESVTMINNRLTVTIRSFDNAPGAGPAPPSDDISATTGDVFLGRFPQGSYNVDAVFLNRVTGTLSPIASTQFTVSEDPAARNSGFPAHDFTDLWWNPAESGWGISIHTKRTSFFAAWFVYDAQGVPTWYTLQGGAWLSPMKYSGSIYVTHAAGNSGLGPISAVTATFVGNGVIDFNGYDNATFNYSVNGFVSSKNITRELF